jgi:hypothetical protein
MKAISAAYAAVLLVGSVLFVFLDGNELKTVSRMLNSNSLSSNVIASSSYVYEQKEAASASAASTSINSASTSTTTSSSSSSSSLPCLTPELDGEWVLAPPPPPDHFDSYACCGLKSGDERVKNMKECETGPHRPHFLNDHRDFIGQPDQLLTSRGAFACSECNFTETHVWKTKALRPFDPHGLCRALGNRTILMIGDSTMAQTASVLITDTYAAGCQTKMRMAFGDTLIHELMGALNRGRHWLEAVEEYRPDIAILTAGAHIFPQKNFTKMIDTVIREIKEARLKYPNMKVIWKTQNAAGRDDSMIHLHPLEAGQRPGGYKISNHHKFFERDNQAIAKLQAAGIPFLDMRMMYSRNDAHPIERNDFLHSCLPGPISVFPQLVQKMMDDEFAVSTCIEKEIVAEE